MNNHIIDGNSKTGFGLNPRQILNISNAGTIKNFYSATYGGGVIFNNGGEVNLSNSAFSNNKVGYTNEGLGGVMWSYNFGIKNTVTNSTFNGNQAKWGGAIANYNCGGSSKIINSTFTNNYAANYGGAVYSYGYGGNVLTEVTGSTFTNNGANSHGGAIYSRADAGELALIVDNSTFTGNYAANYYGGAVTNHIGKSIIKNSRFNGNYALDGGATYNRLGELIISDSSFNNNYATKYDAGAIDGGEKSLTSVTTSTFTNNRAYERGGAGGVYLGTLTIDRSSFNGNYAQNGTGGALYNQGGNIIITNSGFNGNYSSKSSGGAITSESNATTSITNSTFTNNRASINGGAINSNASTTNVESSTFTGNYTQTGKGGAVANDVGTISVNNSVFNNNYSTSNGGAAYNNTGISTFNNSTFNRNFSNNSAGGAIYNESGTININNTAFNRNYSSGETGGAIHNNAGTLNINNSTFSGNFSNDGAGGAIYNNTLGTLNIYNSTFNNNYSSKESGGAIYNNGGTLNVVNSSFAGNFTNKNAGGVIATNGGTLNISNSVFNNNYSSKEAGGAIYNNGGVLNIANSTFSNNFTNKAYGGAIYSKNGTVNIKAENGTTQFSGNKASGDLSAIYIENGKLNLNAGNNGTIIFNDKIGSNSINNTININKTGTATLTEPPAGSPTSGNIAFNQTVSNSTINLYNGTMQLGKENYINANKVNLYGGNLSLINNSIGTARFNNLSINGTTNIGIDADLARGLTDKITSANTVSGTGNININAINVMSESQVKLTTIAVADASTRDYICLGQTRVETPLNKYDVSYNRSGGSLSFSNSGFSSSVIASPVAASSGAYLNQTSAYGEVLGRMDGLLSLSQSERLALKYKNKTASADGQLVFSPTLLPEESAGTWVKQYTSFENIPLKNGPNVSSVGYGMLVGRDTELKDIGNGYTGYLTAYMGYNGSHQNYENVGVYQNGGLVGLTGTAYKGNFFAALTASAGGSAGSNHNSYGIDNFTSVMAGTALKTGYNFEMLRGKLILQPSIMASYTFINTFDYTSASGLNITSDPLNAFQITPGVKLIGNLKGGWQPYLGANMVWNIMDAAKFYANNVPLPELSVLPYAEYGVGLQRKWGDRFTGFGQAMARGGGRNGIALQFGFRWAI